MQNPSKTKHGERALAFLVFHPGFVSQELLLSIFLVGIHFTLCWKATKSHGATWIKENTKRERIKESWLESA